MYCLIIYTRIYIYSGDALSLKLIIEATEEPRTNGLEYLIYLLYRYINKKKQSNNKFEIDVHTHSIECKKQLKYIPITSIVISYQSSSTYFSLISSRYAMFHLPLVDINLVALPLVGTPLYTDCDLGVPALLAPVPSADFRQKVFGPKAVVVGFG